MDGLPFTQRSLLTARAQGRFGKEPTTWMPIEFDEIEADMVLPVTFRHHGKYIPPNPTHGDILKAMGGGYTQEMITVSLVQVDEVKDGYAVITTEKPIFLSHRNGITLSSTGFALCKDGTVMYYLPDDDDEEPKKWSSFIPRWEIARLPIVQPALFGI